MKDALYLAWRYLSFYRIRTIILVASISLISFLPAGLQVLLNQSSADLRQRALSTPLLLGSRGNTLDLTLSTLYFRSSSGEALEFSEAADVTSTGLARGIPVELSYHVGGQPIIGTTLEYADFRGLEIGRGRWMAILGECVLGSNAARQLGVDVGDRILSSSGSAFDVAGSFPLAMPVVGILEPTGTPDDDIVLVDVKTTWVISGLAHGHEDLVRADAPPSLFLEQEDSNRVANASVLIHTEITRDNIDSFHFHGDPGGFPISAVIIDPVDFKSSVLIRGRYEEDDLQIVVPLDVMEELIDTMFSVRDWILAGSLLVGSGTMLTVVLVFALAIRSRRKEIDTIRQIGGGRRQLVLILGLEIAIIILIAGLAAAGLTAVVSRFGGALIRMITIGGLS